MLSPASYPIWHMSSSAEMNPVPSVVHQLLISHDRYVFAILFSSHSSLSLRFNLLVPARRRDPAGGFCATFFHMSKTRSDDPFALLMSRAEVHSLHVFAMVASMHFIKTLISSDQSVIQHIASEQIRYKQK